MLLAKIYPTLLPQGVSPRLRKGMVKAETTSRKARMGLRKVAENPLKKGISEGRGGGRGLLGYFVYPLFFRPLCGMGTFYRVYSTTSSPLIS